MTVEDRLRRALPPDAEGARERGWAVVRASRPVGATNDTTTGPLVTRWIAAAALAALFALSGAGAATGDWVKQRVAPEPKAPKHAIPAGGATWSPHRLFIAVWQDRELRALEPDGDPRWHVTAPAPIRNAKWSPDGLRIAYVAGDRVWIVSGNGTNNHLLRGGRTTASDLRWSAARPQELTYGSVTRDVGTGVRVR